MGPDKIFANLNKNIQEELSFAYNKIQPKVQAVAGFRPEFDLLNKHLNAGFSGETKAFYLAREVSTVDTVLKYENTLFGKLAELKLSQKIDEFLTKKLIPYLEENLSLAIWGQLSFDNNTIDFSKLPFRNFHRDSQEVILYKKLINAVFHLKSSLVGLENLQGDPNSVIRRIPFVYRAFNALVMDLIGIKSNLSAVAGNPGLQLLIKIWHFYSPCKISLLLVIMYNLSMNQ